MIAKHVEARQNLDVNDLPEAALRMQPAGIEHGNRLILQSPDQKAVVVLEVLKLCNQINIPSPLHFARNVPLETSSGGTPNSATDFESFDFSIAHESRDRPLRYTEYYTHFLRAEQPGRS